MYSSRNTVIASLVSGIIKWGIYHGRGKTLYKWLICNMLKESRLGKNIVVSPSWKSHAVLFIYLPQRLPSQLLVSIFSALWWNKHIARNVQIFQSAPHSSFCPPPSCVYGRWCECLRGSLKNVHQQTASRVFAATRNHNCLKETSFRIIYAKHKHADFPRAIHCS